MGARVDHWIARARERGVVGWPAPGAIHVGFRGHFAWEWEWDELHADRDEPCITCDEFMCVHTQLNGHKSRK